MYIAQKVKCELIKEDLGYKVVKLYDTYDKYFEASKGDGGKGLIVNKYVDNNFEDLGMLFACFAVTHY